MTNVPASSQTRPPGLAITSAQQVPGECLRVSVAGKELFSATFQTDYRGAEAPTAPLGLAAGTLPLPPPLEEGGTGPRSPPVLLAHAWVAPASGRAFQTLSSRPAVPRRAQVTAGPAARTGAAPGAGRAGVPPAAQRRQPRLGKERPSNACLAHQPRISTLRMTSAQDCHPPGLWMGFFSPLFPGFLSYKHHFQLPPFYSGH